MSNLNREITIDLPQDSLFAYRTRMGYVQNYGLDRFRAECYRIPEREGSRVKTPIKPGDTITFSRGIARIGYYVQPTDMPSDLLVERAWEALLERCQLYDATVTMEHIKAIYQALDLFPNKFFYSVFRGVRYDWMTQQQIEATRSGIADVNKRTIWYVDLDDAPYRGTVTQKRGVWIGTHYPPEDYTSYGEYGSEYEYYPGGLSSKVYQEVLHVHCPNFQTFLVHPTDATLVKEEKK